MPDKPLSYAGSADGRPIAPPEDASTVPAVSAPAAGHESRPLRLRCIGCEVLARALYLCAARSPHVVDVALLRRGLHDTPATLRERIQAEIAVAESSDPPYDAIVLAYGLCGGATAGIAAVKLPLVLPRAHDCITLFLGSRARYSQEFNSHPGTYWYSAEYIERSLQEQGASASGLAGIGANSKEARESAYADYVARFGRENADYLMQELGAWQAHYDRAVFISTETGDTGQVERRARRDAEQRGWVFEKMAGDLQLIGRLLDGDWDQDFLILEPGHRLEMAYDESILRAAAADSR